jgi:hypothetical protein
MWSGQGWKIAIAKCIKNDPKVLYTNRLWGKDKAMKYYTVENNIPDTPDPDDPLVGKVNDTLVGEVCYFIAISLFVHTF